MGSITYIEHTRSDAGLSPLRESPGGCLAYSRAEIMRLIHTYDDLRRELDFLEAALDRAEALESLGRCLCHALRVPEGGAA